MKTPILLLLALPLAAGQGCPKVEATALHGAAGSLSWVSYASPQPRGKFCIENTLSNVPQETGIAVEWPDAGIEWASIAGSLSLQFCCFDREEPVRGTLRQGEHRREVAISTHVPAEEGAESHKEGYPDLIDADARTSTVGVRGALWDGARSWRVDLVLRCSASQFDRQFAYQFSIDDRSEQKLQIHWNLLDTLLGSMTPMTQKSGFSRTFLFLSAAPPQESRSVIELRAPSGKVVGRFHAGGFTMRKK